MECWRWWVEEIVLFTFDDDDPSRLLEVTLPGDTSTVPAATDTSGWTSLVKAMKQDSDAVEVELTGTSSISFP